jgi:hypothetical protein
MIGHSAGGNMNQPRARVLGDAFTRPLFGSINKGLLPGVFGSSEVVKAANDGPEHLRRQFPQQMLPFFVENHTTRVFCVR